MTAASLRLREYQNQAWMVGFADERIGLVTGLGDVVKTLESCYESVSETLECIESGFVLGIAKTLESCYESVSETLVTVLFCLVFGIAGILGSYYRNVSETLVKMIVKGSGAVQSFLHLVFKIIKLLKSYYKRVGEILAKAFFCLVFIVVVYILCRAVWALTVLFYKFVVICVAIYFKLCVGLFFLSCWIFLVGLVLGL